MFCRKIHLSKHPSVGEICGIFVKRREKNYFREGAIWSEFAVRFCSPFIGLYLVCTELADATCLFSRRDANGHLKPDKPCCVGTTRQLLRARCPARVARAWRARTEHGADALPLVGPTG